jgi:DNA-binding transcriptional MerR regulator/methylmalonyl-CoA mutase cobalamin-binding subunit
VGRPEGKYRIAAVAEMTGIPAATLRAWERRYGLPDPGRSEASYRLYSERDIAMVRRVRELCDQGMAPAQAARVVLEDTTDLAVSASAADPYDQVRDAIVQAIAAFDPQQTANAIRKGMSMGAATKVYDRVFAPAMQEIGDRWQEGTFTVGQEHLASQLLSEAAVAMLRLVERDDADQTVVLGCFADELHAFPSYGVALRLATWGYRVTQLGPRTPPHAVRQATDELEPAFVGLSITVAPPPHRARELVEEYAAACGDTPWLVGGAAAEELAVLVTEHGGIAVVDNSADALQQAIRRAESG